MYVINLLGLRRGKPTIQKRAAIYSNGLCVIGGITQIGGRVASQGVVRHGRGCNTIDRTRTAAAAVTLGAHAARRRPIAPKLSLIWSLPGIQRGPHRVACALVA